MSFTLINGNNIANTSNVTISTLTVSGVATLGTGAILGTPASGTVTNLTGTASININGTVGATTPAAAAVTTLSASGLFTMSQVGGARIANPTGALLLEVENSNLLYVRRADSPFTAWATVGATGTIIYGTLGVAGTSTLAAVNASGIITATNSAGIANQLNASGEYPGVYLINTNTNAARRNWKIRAGAASYNELSFLVGASADSDPQSGTIALTLAAAGVTIPGTLGVTGIITSANSVESAGQLQTYAANKIAMSQESASNSTLTAHGTNSSTYGNLNLRVAYSNGAPLTIATISSTGLAVTGTLTATGTATIGSTLGVTGTTTILKNGGTGATAGLLLNGGGAATTFNIDFGSATANRLWMRQAFSDGTGDVKFQYSSDGTMASPIDVLAVKWGGGIAVNGATTSYGGTAATSNFKTSAAAWTLGLNNANATTCYGLGIKYTAATPNAAGSEFAYWEDATALRFSVKSNGGINNYSANDTNLSDERMKKQIVAIDLNDAWTKNKALQYVTYLYKDQTDAILNHGLVAQQVESVAPEFVDVSGFGETPEDGVPLKGLWETDIFYMLGAVLQKAQLRIEELEARLSRLEAPKTE